ncbi:hypothetical protein BN946_scf184996.g10 [Trametes cinnabarina]|uniref:Uncharacterized protein n=1 Tax=Pycnoporus cinnabarinus TaxID=5643 RepID=A0A060S8H1_PYCCI|nr:hypothetical protein BN946_scf184996.g10 [Trametes cinnabarina]
MSDTNVSNEPLEFDLDVNNMFSIDLCHGTEAQPTLWDPALLATSLEPLPGNENTPPSQADCMSSQDGVMSLHTIGTPAAGFLPHPPAQRSPLVPATLQGHSNVPLPTSEGYKASGESIGSPVAGGTGPAASATHPQSTELQISSDDGESGPGPRSHSRSRSEIKTKSRGGATRGRGRGGRGSKSGPLNRRSRGASDEEISKLDDEAKAAASIPKGLTEEQKLQVVEYVTDERRWPQFRVKQNVYWTELSQEVFKGHVTVTQISNYWYNQVWDKYKACMENLVKPTGGGDGDDDWQGSTDTDGSDTGAEEPLEGSRKRKRALKEKLGVTKFSRNILEEFLHSKIFELVHKRAKNDNSVTRERSFNSAATLSDSDSFKQRLRKRGKINSPEEITSAYIEKALNYFQGQSESQVSWQQRKLELAERREKREEEQWQMQRQLQQREICMRERAQAMEMIMSGDEKLKEMGYMLLDKVKAEEMADIQQLLTPQQAHTMQHIVVMIYPVGSKNILQHVLHSFILSRIEIGYLFWIILATDKIIVKYDQGLNHMEGFFNVFTYQMSSILKP